jgi:hypothetical protein
MSILRFSDGEEFNTSGPLRKEERYDGWYVLGEGKLIPVKDEKEADKIIQELKKIIMSSLNKKQLKRK